jgi:hypothetical protein
MAVDVIKVVLELEVTITQKIEVDQSPVWEDEDEADDPPWQRASIAKIQRASTQDRSLAPTCFIMVEWPQPADHRAEIFE